MTVYKIKKVLKEILEFVVEKNQSLFPALVVILLITILHDFLQSIILFYGLHGTKIIAVIVFFSFLIFILPEKERALRIFARWGNYNSQIFPYLLGLYLLGLLAEMLRPGLISSSFNLNYLLVIVIVSGALTFLLFKFYKEKTARILKYREKYERFFNFFVKCNNKIFPYLLITYLLCLLVESFKKEYISKFLNLKVLLIIVIVSGILTAFALEKEKGPKEKPTRKDYLFIGALGALGAGLVYWKTKELGLLSVVISIVSGALIILLSCLMMGKEEGGELENENTR